MRSLADAQNGSISSNTRGEFGRVSIREEGTRSWGYTGCGADAFCGFEGSTT